MESIQIFRNDREIFTLVLWFYYIFLGGCKCLVIVGLGRINFFFFYYPQFIKTSHSWNENA